MTWDARERLFNDPKFKNLVDMMASFMLNAEFTPSEMREAAILASIRNYEIRPAGITVPLDKLHLILVDVEREKS
jgi:hypothetical protein